MRLAAAHGFNALITADQGIEHQQNLERLPIPVVVMIANRTRVQELRLRIDKVVNLVVGDLQKSVYHVIE